MEGCKLFVSRKIMNLFQAILFASDVLGNPYVPSLEQCPENFQYVRPATTLSDGEASFLASRDRITREALIDWLDHSGLEDFDASSLLAENTVRIGLAFSGGGYRAMLVGAGQLAALDNRTQSSTQDGHVGGLLQASTYISGLSGGNWLLGSVAANNFASVQDLVSQGDIWNLENSLLDFGGLDLIKTADYLTAILEDVSDKQAAGWDISFTDLYGRALGYQLLDQPNGGQGFVYSSIRDQDWFKNAEMPFPIHVADRRFENQKIISLNSSVFEFNPLEIGSWDPNIYHFADLKYLGTAASGGEVSEEYNCTTGLDNAGFLMGSSSSLFNELLLKISSLGLPQIVSDLIEPFLDNLVGDADVCLINPSPFYNIDGISDSQYEQLTLVDGGEDGMNIPLQPLYQPQREVDIILAFDSSSDTDQKWPNGQSMVETFERQFGSQGNGTHFPYVPNAQAFIDAGLVGQPTFFGCDLKNQSTLYEGESFNSEDPSATPPIVAYIANSDHSYSSNIDTFQLFYPDVVRDAIITNGYNIMTQNNGTLDSNWRSALGCAIVLREQQRRNQTPTNQCQQLLSKYCWDGSTTGGDLSTDGGPTRRDGRSNKV